MKKRAVIGIVAMIGITTPAPAGANSSYILTQTIDPIDCTSTQADSGSGTTTATECNGVVAPTVNIQVTTNSQPIITGTFDAASMKYMRVTFRGVTYILGRDVQLTVSGNYWRLDLSGLLPPLAPGTYTVLVEIETLDGKLVQSTSSQQIHIPATSGTEADAARDSLNGPLAATGQSQWFVMGFVGLLLTGGLITLSLSRRGIRNRC